MINIDESWINEKDFRYLSWRSRSVNNTIPVGAVAPRIPMMAAIDTDGQLFMAVSQVNTDSDSKRMLLSELCKVLDADRPDWRDNSVCFMDNASYNRSPETEEYIQKLRIPMIFAAPYAYHASPCEFFFSYFKREMIFHPETPTGKL